MQFCRLAACYFYFFNCFLGYFFPIEFCVIRDIFRVVFRDVRRSVKLAYSKLLFRTQSVWLAEKQNTHTTGDLSGTKWRTMKNHYLAISRANDRLAEWTRSTMARVLSKPGGLIATLKSGIRRNEPTRSFGPLAALVSALKLLFETLDGLVILSMSLGQGRRDFCIQ